MYFSGNTSDTICAPTTGSGMSAIAVIRISGKDACKITSSVFSKNLEDAKTHTLHFGTIKDENGLIVDEVVVATFLGTKSFTGEETIEISCHGSTYIQQQILQLLIRKGCRMANPGEFTYRAFLNGKMDLSQAEAVADLIASETKKAHDVAMSQMRGRFSSELAELREKLIHFASMVELELDFGEEDVEFADRTELKNLVSEVIRYIERLIQSFELGNAIKNGVPVAIVGAPNTGKSTLLNQLLGEERAIVSNIAGTTRDVIEETMNIDGILFRLIDTAGIREHAEEIEAMGIERSKQKIAQAQIVAVLGDGAVEQSTNLGHGTMSTMDALSWAKEIQADFPQKKLVVLSNKMDLASEVETLSSEKIPLIPISAKQGKGVDEFKLWMVNQVQQGYDVAQETIVTNTRHVEALQAAKESLNRVVEGIETDVPSDFVALDIRQAMYHLGVITGQISEEDILTNIFSKFCIGK